MSERVWATDIIRQHEKRIAEMEEREDINDIVQRTQAAEIINLRAENKRLKKIMSYVDHLYATAALEKDDECL